MARPYAPKYASRSGDGTITIGLAIALGCLITVAATPMKASRVASTCASRKSAT